MAITVTSAADDDGNLTLRQAISQASSGDAIEFAADFTIILDSTKGIITIDKNLSINSLGKEVTISGNNATAIFSVQVNNEVSINRLVLRDGKKKPEEDWFGVIRNSGTLTITNSTLSNNYGAFENDSMAYGGAIYNRGTLSIINSTLSNNHAGDGGAIYGGSTISVINSTLSNNHADDGGGAIYSRRTLSIINSTLSNNHAGRGRGGAIDAYDALATITNSTLSGNSGGAIYVLGSARVYISFSTIVYNEGAGIYAEGYENHGPQSTSTICKNSILANNGSNFSHNDFIFTFQAFGVNFSTDNTCSGFTQVSLDELKLGPLALNSPGSTETIALLKGSVAIDTVTDFTDLSGNVVNTDQRGISRPQKTAGDAGSYEFVPDPIRGISLF